VTKKDKRGKKIEGRSYKVFHHTEGPVAHADHDDAEGEMRGLNNGMRGVSIVHHLPVRNDHQDVELDELVQ